MSTARHSGVVGRLWPAFWLARGAVLAHRTGTWAFLAPVASITTEARIRSSDLVVVGRSLPLLVASLLPLLCFVLTNVTAAADAPSPTISPFDKEQAKRHQQQWADYLKLPLEYTNSIGMKFVLIPPGEITMGSPETEAGRLKDEPQHRVRISRPYYIGTYEVRSQDFERFVEAEDYRTDAERDELGGWGWDRDEKRFGQKAKFTWRSWGADESPSCPAVNVSWNDAAGFCKWLSQKESQQYRLPTEAEWEYACRAGTNTTFCNGNEYRRLVEIGNVADGNAKEVFPGWSTVNGKDGNAFICSVGSFKPNAFGLYDVTGNAAEWCGDWYDRDYYLNSPPDDPQGPAGGSERVIRGGSWYRNPDNCRSAYRGFAPPGYRRSDLGFRVVREQ